MLPRQLFLMRPGGQSEASLESGAAVLNSTTKSVQPQPLPTLQEPTKPGPICARKSTSCASRSAISPWGHIFPKAYCWSAHQAPARPCSLATARRGSTQVSRQDFEHALDKLLLGGKREALIDEWERRIVAYHEGGHALVAAVLPDVDPDQADALTNSLLLSSLNRSVATRRSNAASSASCSGDQPSSSSARLSW